MGFGSFLGSSGEESFDEHGDFVPGHLPEPGEFLEGHEVLTGEAHVAFHGTARDLFEERGVYDMTFGYNLARLNLDTRHPTAGFRYAEEIAGLEGAAGPEGQTGEATDGIDGPVLRAEFTPTTEFCPQSDTLTLGAFRAFNGELESHAYDLVRVRVDGMHHESASINGKLRQLEESFAHTGEVRSDVTPDSCAEEVPSERGYGSPGQRPGTGDRSAGRDGAASGGDGGSGPTTPF
ncbi:hypothetical protein [Salinirussus salinus]|uniref:hypothetical protein n=1 Tax=Salinirussus salinus TaxID=1198300 RepID=UPI001F415B8D|nr:hypothetical protein [Salinirussus salinus]